MKKIAFTIAVIIALFVLSGIILAGTDPEYDKALAYYNSGKYEEAITLLKEYIKKKPDPSAYYRIGYALYKLRKFDEANKYFEMAYLIDPMFSPKEIGLTPPYPHERMKETAEPLQEQVPEK